MNEKTIYQMRLHIFQFYHISISFIYGFWRSPGFLWKVRFLIMYALNKPNKDALRLNTR